MDVHRNGVSAFITREAGARFAFNNFDWPLFLVMDFPDGSWRGMIKQKASLPALDSAALPVSSFIWRDLLRRDRLLREDSRRAFTSAGTRGSFRPGVCHSSIGCWRDSRHTLAASDLAAAARSFLPRLGVSVRVGVRRVNKDGQLCSLTRLPVQRGDVG